MKKLTKTQVKAILKKLKDDQTTSIFFTTSKTHLSGYKCWVTPYEIELTNDLEEFEKKINEFYFHNCNSEVGNTVHFYINE